MPSLTRAQAREVDRIAMEDLKIPGILLMENAARGISEAISDRFPATDGPIAIVCGPGNNGGDGFAAARHLANAGRAVRIHLAKPAAACREGSDAATNLAIASAMDLAIAVDADFQGAGLLVDAVFGTGLARAVEAPYRGLIEAINAASAPVVAVDMPSGLDADTGEIHGVAVRADLTVTMVAPKVGFALGEGPAHVGEVVVVDIGAPPEAIRRALASEA